MPVKFPPHNQSPDSLIVRVKHSGLYRCLGVSHTRTHALLRIWWRTTILTISLFPHVSVDQWLWFFHHRTLKRAFVFVMRLSPCRCRRTVLPDTVGSRSAQTLCHPRKSCTSVFHYISHKCTSIAFTECVHILLAIAPSYGKAHNIVYCYAYFCLLWHYKRQKMIWWIFRRRG